MQAVCPGREPTGRNLYFLSHHIMKSMSEDLKKMDENSAKTMLHHWIEHNESHSKSFRERAGQVRAISEKAAQDINDAADLMDKCTQMLKKAVQDL